MPIYEYLCESCGHRFEVKQKISDPPVNACARCGKAVRRLISSPAIMFKGSGWYVTDYSDKLKAPGEAAGNGKAAEAKPEAKTDKADIKSEKASEGKAEVKEAKKEQTSAPSSPVPSKESSSGSGSNTPKS
jgi:putative FmdB family regulatory protein